MKTIRRLLALQMVTYSLASFGGQMIPVDIRQYAAQMQSDLLKMVASDSGMMKDAGIANAAQLGKYTLNYDKAFMMQKVDASQLEGAATVGKAVVETGSYYVPLCDGSRCPMMASFNRDGDSGAPAFESVGQPNLTQQIESAKAELAKDPSVDPNSLQPVEYNEGQVNFLLAKKADGSGDVLIPQSDNEQRALMRVLDRPTSEKDSRGRAKFNLADMRIIAKNVRERAQTQDTTPTSGLSAPDQFSDDKPYNESRRTPKSTEIASPITAAAKTGMGSVEEVAAATRPLEDVREGRGPAHRFPVIFLGFGFGILVLLSGYVITRKRK